MREKIFANFGPKLWHTVRQTLFFEEDPMTIRARLILWYAGILTLSLLVIGIGTCLAIFAQLSGDARSHPEFQPASVAVETFFCGVLPAVGLGLLGGWWLARRALAPVAELTEAMRKIQQHQLREPLPVSGSGDELDQLTGVFNAVTARLDGSASRTRDFTLQAAHELKTPLAELCAELELEMRDESLSESDRLRQVGQLEEMRRLVRLVDGVVLLARADAGQIKLAQEPVRWDGLIRDNFADAVILADPLEIRVELSAREAVTVLGDQYRLRQLLSNLTSNAVRFNRFQGHILMVLRRVGDTAEFTISNTGPGIAPEILPRVFDRFFRSNSARSSGPDGCGLGLSIAQWIVAAHKGTITIETPEAELTMVRVKLPVYIPPA